MSEIGVVLLEDGLRTGRIKGMIDCIGMVTAKSPLLKDMFLVELVGRSNDEWISTVITMMHTDIIVLTKWHYICTVGSIIKFTKLKNSIIKYRLSNGDQRKRVLLKSNLNTQLDIIPSVNYSKYDFIHNLIYPSIENNLCSFIQSKHQSNNQFELIPFIQGTIIRKLSSLLFLLKTEDSIIPITFLYYKLERTQYLKLGMNSVVTLWNIHKVPIKEQYYNYRECLVCCSYSSFDLVSIKSENLLLDDSSMTLRKDLELYNFPIALKLLYLFDIFQSYLTPIFDDELSPDPTSRPQLGKPKLFSYEQFQQRIYEKKLNLSVKSAEINSFRQYIQLLNIPESIRSIHDEFVDHQTCIASNTNCIIHEEYYLSSLSLESLMENLPFDKLDLVHSKLFPGL